MIGIYCPDVPPQPGGVSDHTLVLARALQKYQPVVVLARRGDPAAFRPIPCDVGLRPAGLTAAARAHGVTTLIIQYVPFLFARRGISPGLIASIGAIRSAGLRIAVILHEPFVPFTRLPWLFTGLPQRAQLWYLLHHAAFVYTGVPAFRRIAIRYASRSTRTTLAPIGATIVPSTLTRHDARALLGLAPDDVAIGIFSPAASGYATDWIAAAVRRVADVPNVRWVRFGFGSDRPIRGLPSDGETITVGPGSARQIADTMRAMDIAVSPYVDGLSLRRSSAMLALATGVPLISSRGSLYEPIVGALAACEATASAFADRVRDVVTHPDARAALAARTQGYAESASVEELARRISNDLGSSA
jgi:glycosyltransferase involved in cell wall biosynthesis